MPWRTKEGEELFHVQGFLKETLVVGMLKASRLLGDPLVNEFNLKP